MAAVHSVIDYALARRAVLADVAAGRLAPSEVCDAHPYLLRAARYHGERSGTDCPVCHREQLVHVSYAYGDRLGDSAGQAVAREAVPALVQRYGQVRLYLVEVCRSCAWNHLVSGYTVDADPAAHRGEPAGVGRQRAERHHGGGKG